MSDFLHIPYRLRRELHPQETETIFRFCFQELGCSRANPTNGKTNQFRYTTERTSGVVVGESVEEAITAVVEASSGAIWCWYDDLNVGISVGGKTNSGPSLPSVSLLIDEWYTMPWRNEEPSLIHDFVLELYDYLSPMYVYGDTYLDESSLTTDGVDCGQLEDLFWVNGFGPEMTEQIGRERLLEAPAWRVDDCEDGGVFLWLSPLPLSESRNERMDALRAYFDLDS